MEWGESAGYEARLNALVIGISDDLGLDRVEAGRLDRVEAGRSPIEF